MQDFTLRLNAKKCCFAEAYKLFLLVQESIHSRRLQQLLPPLPINIPLPPFLTGGGGNGGSGGLGGLLGGLLGGQQQSTSLQTQPPGNNTSGCTATFAQVHSLSLYNKMVLVTLYYSAMMCACWNNTL